VQSAGPGSYLLGVMLGDTFAALRLTEEPMMNDGLFVISPPQGL